MVLVERERVEVYSTFALFFYAGLFMLSSLDPGIHEEQSIKFPPNTNLVMPHFDAASRSIILLNIDVDLRVKPEDDRKRKGPEDGRKRKGPEDGRKKWSVERLANTFSHEI